MVKLIILLFFTSLFFDGPDPNRLCGKWISAEKNLIIQVYKEGEDYKAKIIWFKNVDKTRTMDEVADEHNPEKELRERKLLGMSVLKNLDYQPESNSWEHGKVYDAKNGREWDASAQIDMDGELKVTGYWHFKFIGKTLTFTRIKE